MTHVSVRRLWLVPAALLLFVAAATWLGAQEPGADPFSPFGDTKAAAPAVPSAAQKKDAEAPAETDPLILGIRDSRPSTPAAVMQAAVNVLNYGRPDEAKRYLGQLLNSKLDDAALWRLQRQFGTATLMRLTREEAVQPEGKQLADVVLAGANRFVRDPARLNELIKQLSDTRPEVRHAASVDLEEAREEGVIALISVLGDASRAAEHAAVKGALRRMGEIAVGPLRGSLSVSDPAWRAQIVAVLGSLQTRAAIPFLLRPHFLAEPGGVEQAAAEDALRQMLGGLPTKPQAERFLEKETLAYLAGRLPGEPDHENRIELWQWEEAQQRPVPVRLDTTAAPLFFAERLGAELAALAPENRDYQLLHLVAVLESAQFRAGWDASLPVGEGTAFALAASRFDLLEDTLQFALEYEHMGAALGAIQVLGARGTEALVQGTAGQPRVLVKALRNPDRRVRFAALQAIAHIAPATPYAGASYLPETLAYFSRTAGARRILIAYPRAEVSQSLAGMFLELGIEADVVLTGSEAFLRARQSADYEFVLLSDAIDAPNVQEQLQQFRLAPLTAELPVGILARSENLDRLTRLVSADPLTEVFAQPADAAGISFVIRRMVERAGRDFVPYEVRIQQAQFALREWAFLAEHSAELGFYDLIAHQEAAEAAIAVPSLAPEAARVLGFLGTAESQRALLDFINQRGRPLQQRQAATAAFDVAVRRRGILLTTQEIQRQYDLYNQSATADAGTQGVLSSVLDILEAPSLAATPGVSTSAEP